MKKSMLVLSIISAVWLNAVDYDITIMDEKGYKRVIDMSKYISKNLSRSIEINTAKETIEGTDCNNNISITKTDKSILITSDEFGPLPITLIVKNKDGKEILKKISEDDVSIFEIFLNKLDSNSTFEITNTFNEKLVCNKIIKE